MKEAFEKIKERLEERRRLVGHFSRYNHDMYVAGVSDEVEVALSIVSEVEAEYGNPKTNADRIRAMGDKELAEILISNEDNYMFFTTDGEEFRNFKDALEHQIEWLKSPIE